MEPFTALFADTLGRGASLEEALGLLRAKGASPVQAIKAVAVIRGVGLGEAKRIFSESPTWVKEVQAGDALHGEVIALIEKELKA